jgi:hypothetical protein
MRAGESTFGANAAEEEEQGCLIALSLNNLANASIQKNSMIDSLVVINAQLTQALADMQIAMACMSPPVHAPPYSGTILVWGPNPPPTAAPPAAPSPPQANALTQHPSHWGTIKPIWDKVGYCWTHGFKVKIGHNCTTCSSCCTGHQPPRAPPVAPAINRARHGPTSWGGVGTTKATPVPNARHPPHCPPDGAIQRESLLLM